VVGYSGRVLFYSVTVSCFVRRSRRSVWRADRVNWQVRNAMTAKLSPVRLTYALMRCKLMTLDASSGIAGIASPAYRPSNIVLEFPGDAPPAAGPATIWVQAHIQNHKLHVRDTRGAPNGSPRGGILDVDSGQPYYTELLRARDPEEEWKMQQHYWPHLGALRLRVGDSGEAVDWMFLSGAPVLPARVRDGRWLQRMFAASCPAAHAPQHSAPPAHSWPLAARTAFCGALGALSGGACERMIESKRSLIESKRSLEAAVVTWPRPWQTIPNMRPTAPTSTRWRFP